MVCRVRVDAIAGIVELEGEAAFVSDFFDKLLPLIEQAGFGSGKQEVEPDAGIPAAGDASDDAAGKGKAPKPKRKKRPTPPPGASCRDRIITLKADGIFKNAQTIPEIVAALAKKGWTHNGNQVGAALTIMFNKDEIQRTNDGSGFKYYWDRD